ncbi:MRG/MORF4L-binding protein [Lingula anatina]|uniref:MRG/MORF4L-binding protein n=1 Tax=Lingula anatina TaxID=7574 RepID=A0A1S3K811_LINAN|nr:MRG/MORF4L-binding protein [Lingula anatina]|eukprot:XP_013418775.1 MRG/MORF4L-binding protein [Lingula anatina]
MAEDDPAWNVDMEVSLFHAMRGHKPVGVNRHFQMLFIHEKLNSPSYRKVSSKQIWAYLATLYDLQALNESEILPFPNKSNEFSLPEAEYGDLMNKEPSKTSGGKDTGSEDVQTTKSTSKSSASSTPILTAATPDSPKRKRTRQTHSQTSSPATGSEGTPSTKRARRI